MADSGMLTVKEAAKRMHVSASLIYSLLKARRLKAVRIGCRGRGKWLIREGDVETYLAAAQVYEPSPKPRPLKYL